MKENERKCVRWWRWCLVWSTAVTTRQQTELEVAERRHSDSIRSQKSIRAERIPSDGQHILMLWRWSQRPDCDRLDMCKEGTVNVSISVFFLAEMKLRAQDNTLGRVSCCFWQQYRVCTAAVTHCLHHSEPSFSLRLQSFICHTYFMVMRECWVCEKMVVIARQDVQSLYYCHSALQKHVD